MSEEGAPSAVRPVLGIVIPTLNEAGHLPPLLDDLSELSVPHRVVVVDGGSVDGTVEQARARGAEVRTARRGRAYQLNAGASAVGADWLLFLHADVRLPAEARAVLEAWLRTGDSGRAAFFRFRLAGDHRFYRFVEWGQRLREGALGLAYGDQGLVVARELFEAVGGYPEIPIMEDVEIVRSLRGRTRLHRLPADLVSSPRRYEREGRWLGWLRNGMLLGLHLAGVPPRTLARWYRPEPEPGEPRGEPVRDGRSEEAAGPAEEQRGKPPREETPETPRPGGVDGDRILLVFAKAPVEGQVKTRLAEDLGSRKAAELYREVGRRVVDQLRGGRYRIVVCYDPPGAGGDVRTWLGSPGLTFRAQDGGDLGERMAAAFRWAFERGREVCIVGTDAPGVDRAVVEEAFGFLADADVVVGPATDGGYYLMALSEPRDALFRDVEWSTSDVLATTLEHVAGQDLTLRLLRERTDLDTSEDLERLGLSRD